MKHRTAFILGLLLVIGGFPLLVGWETKAGNSIPGTPPVPSTA